MRGGTDRIHVRTARQPLYRRCSVNTVEVTPLYGLCAPFLAEKICPYLNLSICERRSIFYRGGKGYKESKLLCAKKATCSAIWCFLRCVCHEYIYRTEGISWVKGSVGVVLKFVFPPFSPPLTSGMQISNQNMHGTFDPNNK